MQGPAADPHPDEFSLHLDAGLGLARLLSQGADVAAPPGEPLGVLGLELVRGSHATDPEVSVEAFYGYHGALRQIQRLDVRVHARLDAPPSPDLASSALEAFAGTAFTNLVLARADGHELCDLSVSVAPRVRVWVHNALLAGDGLSPDEIGQCVETFHCLGIAGRSGTELRVASHQVRRPPTLTEQVETFRVACTRFAHVELFASPLPPGQSVRLAFDAEASGCDFDLTLTRSDLEHTSVAHRTCAQMQALLGERFGFEFGDTEWRGRNFHAEREPFESHGAVPDRPRRSWSVNWNARNR
jgi:hypothetical protein